MLTAAIWAACASPGAPPGGPEDLIAPNVIGVAPESGAVRTTPRNVVFRFDEVVSERPTGVQGLASLFLISPQEGNPVVDWRRSEVSVRPRRGWRPNTTYTVTLLPGITDLRGNVSREQHVVVFSTGAEIPQTAISGVVYDWVAGAPGISALVQAITPDSLIYATVADSAGTFTLPHLPPGQYFVQGLMDQNRNRALDPRELFDSLTVSLQDTLTLELFAAVRDSIPPRMSSVDVIDSVTLRVNFDLPLEPGQILTRQQISVSGPETDSVIVRLVSAVPPDTTPTPMPRPRPPRALRILVTQLQPDATYVVRTTGVRGLTGISGPSERQVRTPAEFQRDTAVAEP
jgi:hypothetical protein